jgi:hypothetical protein
LTGLATCAEKVSHLDYTDHPAKGEGKAPACVKACF